MLRNNRVVAILDQILKTKIIGDFLQCLRIDVMNDSQLQSHHILAQAL